MEFLAGIVYFCMLMLDAIKRRMLIGLSQLPLSVTYGFADVLYVLQRYVIGYRRGVVEENLRNAFPEKSEEERQAIHREFDRNLCDYAMETVRNLSIGAEELDERMEYEALEVFAAVKAEGKNCLLLCGHIFNWEWLTGLIAHLPTRDKYAVYHEVHDKVVDDLVREARERLGNKSIRMQDTVKTILALPNDGESTFLFVADQSPAAGAIQHSLRFLNQETPVFTGFGKLAERLDMGVVYCYMQRRGRGRYAVRFVRLMPEAEKWATGEVVQKYFEILEENIREQPSNWLWSHRRWKYKKGVYW
ncbi:MAG: lysophospholipid acyltransferase family protein [Weeksellaceae bacterium]|nr:lysophospholipid acyltransferase family protein [Weeksellaceae bacterium]